MRIRAMLVAIIAATTLTAQERVPHNDSIRKEDLRADLFFYASDTMRGRLTDTVENRMEKIVRLVHATSWAVANQDARPRQTATAR